MHLDLNLFHIFWEATPACTRLQPPMQTALMSADEPLTHVAGRFRRSTQKNVPVNLRSYSQLVCRNQTWLALLRSARRLGRQSPQKCARVLWSAVGHSCQGQSCRGCDSNLQCSKHTCLQQSRGGRSSEQCSARRRPCKASKGGWQTLKKHQKNSLVQPKSVGLQPNRNMKAPVFV